MYLMNTVKYSQIQLNYISLAKIAEAKLKIYKMINAIIANRITLPE